MDLMLNMSSMQNIPKVQADRISVETQTDTLLSDLSSASEDEPITTDEENNADPVTAEDLAKCMQHVQSLVKRIGVLQSAVQKSQPKSCHSRKRVHKLYKRFCRKVEAEVFPKFDKSAPVHFPLPGAAFQYACNDIPPVCQPGGSTNPAANVSAQLDGPRSSPSRIRTPQDVMNERFQLEAQRKRQALLQAQCLPKKKMKAQELPDDNVATAFPALPEFKPPSTSKDVPMLLPNAEVFSAPPRPPSRGLFADLLYPEKNISRFAAVANDIERADHPNPSFPTDVEIPEQNSTLDGPDASEVDHQHVPRDGDDKKEKQDYELAWNMLGEKIRMQVEAERVAQHLGDGVEMSNEESEHDRTITKPPVPVTPMHPARLGHNGDEESKHDKTVTAKPQVPVTPLHDAGFGYEQTKRGFSFEEDIGGADQLEDFDFESFLSQGEPLHPLSPASGYPPHSATGKQDEDMKEPADSAPVQEQSTPKSRRRPCTSCHQRMLKVSVLSHLSCILVY